MTTEKSASRVIVAIDKRQLKQVLALVQELSDGSSSIIKVRGSLLRQEKTGFVVGSLGAFGATVFADVKLNDIPKSMAEDASELFNDGVRIITVMAASGVEGMKAAVGAKRYAHDEVLAVTVLTSFDERTCEHTFGASVEAKVKMFALDALTAGVSGIVCSPKEAAMLRSCPEFAALTINTPGIRPTWAVPAGQTRFTTPTQAIEAGADRLIIGDPIINPPKEFGSSNIAIKNIKNEITNALLKREMRSKS